jgi:polyhydroxyalkanoate synthesis regulator phasin
MASRKTLEETLAGFVAEAGKVFGEDAVAGALAGVARTLARTKARVDSNVETALSLANLPSKGDLDRLGAKVDALQRSVSNLSRKIDRLSDPRKKD